MNRVQGVVVSSVLLTTAACASLGMNSVEKLNQLSPGQTSDEVQAILGEPESSELTEDKWVLRYVLHQNWRGFVPYYMVFDGDTRTLETWYTDEAEYQRMQEQMGEVVRPLLEAQGQAGAATPAGPNDPELQGWITGNYYYFSSSMIASASSEQSVVLCVDGRFRTTGEFSASGTDATWGTASQSGGDGRWTISGDRQSGTITLTFGDGSSRNMVYQVGSQEEQTMLFDQVRFVYAGVADCG
jgi:hypothetical protein